MSAPELSDLGLSRAQLQFELSKQKTRGAEARPYPRRAAKAPHNADR